MIPNEKNRACEGRAKLEFTFSSFDSCESYAAVALKNLVGKNTP